MTEETKKAKVGMEVYSPYFKKWLKISSIETDQVWHFVYNNRNLAAQTPLSYFEKRGLVR